MTIILNEQNEIIQSEHIIAEINNAYNKCFISSALNLCKVFKNLFIKDQLDSLKLLAPNTTDLVILNTQVA